LSPRAKAPASAATHGSFRPDIEGLRAIAVMAVVGFHYGVRGLRGGFVGVDIFFVISGYLITDLLTAEIHATGSISLARFYARRGRRLLPAALLVTLVTLAAGLYVLSPLEQPQVIKAAAASSLYLSNFLFLHGNLGYFSPESAFNPFLHTWSLSVEEQFYIFWPTFILLISRTKRFPRLPIVAIAVASLCSLALCIWLTHVTQPWAFYGSPARIWEFGVGGLASIRQVTNWARDHRAVPAMGWIGACVLVCSCFVAYNPSNFPGPSALLAALSTVVVLISGTASRRHGPIVLLGREPFQTIGKLSYSIYLWHWPVIVYATVMRPTLSATGRLYCALLAGSSSPRF
jgi:peptidoglycan/LPS O-acetylase OafA/YrhL